VTPQSIRRPGPFGPGFTGGSKGPALLLAVALSTSLAAIAGAQAPKPAAPPTARAAAPIDLTGYWVSIVTEDWRWRMLTPPKGSFESVPLNAEGRKVANTWDPANTATDGCKAYGAAGIMRMPGRLHITWENERTLKIETDAGQQTRLLNFDKTVRAAGPRTWQGQSVAEWELVGGRGGAARGQAPPGPGALKVTTANLRSGYLRKNGVPYSEDASVTEYFDRLVSSGSDWVVVLTTVEDPRYLAQPFVTSTHFKREPDGAKWAPTPCETGKG
jgi:hypothetical protein